MYEPDNKELLRHLHESFKYGCLIVEGAGSSSFSVPIIFGIGSRESAWGLALKPVGPAGTGDSIPRRYMTRYRVSSLPPDGGGFGRGLMQIDYDAHDFARTVEDWKDPRKNILYGCSVLESSKKFLKDNIRTNITEEGLVRAAIAGYNSGPGNVLKAIMAGDDVDSRTAHFNYSQDVLARAKWFDDVGGWGKLQR